MFNLFVAIINMHITQTTPKHNGLKQDNIYFVHKSSCVNKEENSLAPLDVSWAGSKSLHSGC